MDNHQQNPESINTANHSRNNNVRIILGSTSTLAGQSYLAYLKDTLTLHFAGISKLLFVPYARPGGISHATYTESAARFFATLNIEVENLGATSDPLQAVSRAEAIFTGGGNTFLLVKTLHELGLMTAIRERVLQGVPYLGTSAGANIGGLTMGTTNDMPIVYPPSFNTMGLVPFNINPHFISGRLSADHMGETRETRIQEFLTQNKMPVVGLPEGSWIQVNGAIITLEGTKAATIFKKDGQPYELTPGSRLLLQ